MLEPRINETNDRTSVELFAGGGGLAWGVHSAGFRPLLVNELVKHACATLTANKAELRGDQERLPEPGDKWPLVPGDVSEVEFHYLWDRVHLLAGGPPCQPFSLGGVARGDEDKRNMFPQMFRAIREIQPKVVMCENVQGLLRPSFRPYFEYIERELGLPFEERDAGATWQEHDKILQERLSAESPDPKKRYQVITTRVNAADYGVPQIRNRIIIVAFRSDLGVDVEKFKKSIAPTHSEGALIRSIKDGSYWKRHDKARKKAKLPPIPAAVKALVESRLPKQEPFDDGKVPWLTLRDALLYEYDKGEYQENPLPPVSWEHLDRIDREPNGIRYHVGWPAARIYPGHTPNELDKPAKTVKAGVHGVPGGESVLLTDDQFAETIDDEQAVFRHRYMTVRETARVMTFPDEWKLAGPRGEQMRQLGNAVPVKLAEFFATAVAAALDDADKRR
ncbi:DNA cytosine methyltransferase [Actinoplanes sp. NBRC 101535]|uniref:DNA cytosine methyltransferase n=1 Tax=Actinoplanes sp. NBRC 101535 TaxID=3032196 RepID=UPI0024A390C0|nr:DNA cytosine methyltransferase [Actinoplanes sp. NBRC 101535]GLY05009.1 cytosine-specific methyltransferase [Actinoplanes sp. NBRC 101535]